MSPQAEDRKREREGEREGDCFSNLVLELDAVCRLATNEMRLKLVGREGGREGGSWSPTNIW